MCRQEAHMASRKRVTERQNGGGTDLHSEDDSFEQKVISNPPFLSVRETLH